MLKIKQSMIFLLGLLLILSLSYPVLAEEMVSGNTEASSVPMVTDKININVASLDELTKLDRIGPKYAGRIIEYREKYGPFAKPEDIMKVRGIGNKTYESNKDRITVE